MASIISSFDAFEEQLDGSALLSSKSPRLNALRAYFAMGGVISIEQNGSSWPKLLYPNSNTLSAKISRLRGQRSQLNAKRRLWEMKLMSAKVYFTKHEVLKLKEPLYWKHLSKLASDADYRHDVELVKLPANLVADPRWKPMVKMFINDLEYRKQLSETVSTSVVYRNERRVARYAEVLQNFRADISRKKLGFLNSKIAEIDSRLATLNAMMGWVKG